ncbi:MAG: DNA alkylation repair protein [Candidatus Krumholzibacteriota bacterium]|nr:DNA alkylation repair protein [Candidatus Krumholzibacteriota bacterium]
MTDSKAAAARAADIAADLAALGPVARTADLRAVRRDWSRRLRDLPARDMVALGLALVHEHDRRWIGYEMIHFHRAALAGLTAKDLEAIGRGMASWWAVDGFGVLLAGYAWRDGHLPDARVGRWARSRDRWWRRAALVSTVPLNLRSRGGAGDAPRTLAVCRLLLDDRDDMVVKAMSWALRALAVQEPRAVRAFLAETEGRLAARARRETINKLETGLKNPRGGRGAR